MKKVLALIFCISLLFAHLPADEIVVDYQMSPYATGQNILTIDHQLMRLSNRISSPNKNWLADPEALNEVTFQEALAMSSKAKSGFGTVAHMGLRWLELACVWAPIHLVEAFAQYSLGINYRIREGNSVTLFNSSYFREFSYQGPKGHFYDEVWGTSGADASRILTNQMEVQWLENRFIDGRSAVLYSIAQIFSKLSPNFVDEKILRFNDNRDYRVKNLLETKWTQYLNPFTYYAAASTISYCVFNTGLPVWGIPVMGKQFLPVYNLIASPYGPAHEIKGYLWGAGVAPLAVNVGFTGGGSGYLSFGLLSQKLIQTRLGSLGLRFNGWRQRQNVSQPDFGGSCSLMYQYPFFKSERSFFQFEGGWKTKGYISGMPIHASPILSLGMNIQF